MEIVDWPELKATEVWAHEAGEFTPWLAENLELLGEPLGLDLALVDTEVNVGPFHADIVAKTLDGKTVVIENQLTKSDHDHLGKLLTYAAGLEADYIVWIAPAFRPEHLAAIRWVNAGSKEGTAFFALTVEAVAVGGRQAGVRLRPVIEVELADPTDEQQLSEPQRKAQAFWAALLEEFKAAYPGWTKATKPPVFAWITLPAGGSWYWFGISFAKKQKQLRVEFYTQSQEVGDRLFRCLERQRDEIERDFGAPLSWEPEVGQHATRVAFYTDGVLEDTSQWPALRSWIIEHAGKLRDAITPRLAPCVSEISAEEAGSI